MGIRVKNGRAEQEELIKMEIALDYPVLWSFERVLRDLIQNFYDSIGMEKFGEDFQYSCRREPSGTFELTMKTAGRPFSYEWLVYIGGSTKTGAGNRYIGKYGEGFKICMLNLLRMGIEDIVMHSQDWNLRPCIYQEEIDGGLVDMAGYLHSPCPDDNITSLVIRGIPTEYSRWLEEGLLHFFYPENPLFGEKAGEKLPVEGEPQVDTYYTMYLGNGREVPCRHRNCRGIMYLNNLARGRLPFPVFINLSGCGLRFPDTRKRLNLNDFQVWQNMYIMAQQMTPEDSFRLLLLMEDYWNDLPKSRYDFTTWYYVICQLVRNVAASETMKTAFARRYGNLAYIERKDSDKKRNSLIDRTAIWARRNHSGRLVNPVFRLLGAESLTRQFIEESMSGKRPPDRMEKKMIGLLTDCYQAIIPQKMQIPLPEIRIGTRRDAEADPLCFADRISRRKGNDWHQKYMLHHLIFCEEDLEADAFETSLVKVMDAMLQTYGSARSNRMNVIFTDLGSMLIDHPELIIKARRKWIQYAETRRG